MRDYSIKNFYKGALGNRRTLKPALIKVKAGGHTFYNITDNTWDVVNENGTLIQDGDAQNNARIVKVKSWGAKQFKPPKTKKAKAKRVKTTVRIKQNKATKLFLKRFRK